MKIRAFVLTAGLIALGANAAWALDQCKTNLDGQVRNSGNHCTSKVINLMQNGVARAQGTKPIKQKVQMVAWVGKNGGVLV